VGRGGTMKLIIHVDLGGLEKIEIVSLPAEDEKVCHQFFEFLRPEVDSLDVKAKRFELHESEGAK
jgi:hypothetical protein